MQINKELIQRYHLGQCTPEEQHLVEQWLESDDAEMSFPDQIDLHAMQEKGWKKISSRHHLSGKAFTAAENSVKKVNYRLIWQLAACIALVIAAAVFYYTKDNPQQRTMISYRLIRADKGQKLNVTLPDGTKVWLNSESSLKYPLKFGTQSRQVEFIGEAYFSVAKDHLHPFIITTAKTSIRVLGTKFNVRAYAAEPNTTVVVEEGKVRFAAGATSTQLILTANERGSFSETEQGNITMKKDNVYAGKYLAWKHNELILDNQSIAQIEATLERWYNVKVDVLSPKLRKEHYTGSFSNPSLTQVMESISFAVKCNYKQDGRTLIIY